MADKIETRCRVVQDDRACNAPIYLNHDKCENGHPAPQDQIDELRGKMVEQKLDHKRQGEQKKIA